ncbi:MAG: hypothetical protein EOM02_00470, partial [Synergistales bacterium]|nr:hypothetical protein [Synergistales bacterium]
NSVVLLGSNGEERSQMICMLGTDSVKAGLHAGKIVKEVSSIFGGKGGGKPNMAQAGGARSERIKDALSQASDIVKGFLS